MRNSRLVEQTAELIAAYVSRNALPMGDLASAIHAVHSALSQLQGVPAAPQANGTYPSPSEVSASIERDRIISFLDGRPYRTLKRHLSAHGLTPEHYRTRFGLPADYPMVAPGYAAVRSRIARETQLGRKVA